MKLLARLSSQVFGSGDPRYDRCFGRIERRFLRQAGKASDPVRLAYYRGIAFGVQEMNRLLFLFESSPFRSGLAAITPEAAAGLVESWAALALAVLSADEGLPPPPAEAPTEIRAFLARSTGRPHDAFAARVADCSARLGDKGLYDGLLAEVCKASGTTADLEIAITFGLLLNRMLGEASARCHRLVPPKLKASARAKRHQGTTEEA
ncbi:MAG: hypothetical protein KA419_05800 [Acidobacteria bacterium]|nr:hypothetical protein [Acidobacteriota bacterium]